MVSHEKRGRRSAGVFWWGVAGTREEQGVWTDRIAPGLREVSGSWRRLVVESPSRFGGVVVSSFFPLSKGSSAAGTRVAAAPAPAPDVLSELSPSCCSSFPKTGWRGPQATCRVKKVSCWPNGVGGSSPRPGAPNVGRWGGGGRSVGREAVYTVNKRGRDV